MDIKAKIEEIIASLTKDNNLMENFKSDPMGTVKNLLGSIDLDNETISNIVDGVKAKISLDKLGSLGGIADKLGGLFNK